MGVDVSAFDVKANEMGDLLMVKGGVEQYLQMVEGHMNVPDEFLLLPLVMSAVSPTSPTIQSASLP